MRLDRRFFARDVLEVAPELVGMTLVRRFDPPSPKAPHDAKALRGKPEGHSSSPILQENSLGYQPVSLNKGDSVELRAMVTEVEAYRGEEDLASHARFGRTLRNEVMYGEAGHVYVYLIYGMYWMLNIVTGRVGEPQAVLIRGVKELNSDFNNSLGYPSTPLRTGQPVSLKKGEAKEKLLTGPGRVGRWLGLDGSFYGEDVTTSGRLWLEDRSMKNEERMERTTRVGVEYAGVWAEKPWRWVLRAG